MQYKGGGVSKVRGIDSDLPESTLSEFKGHREHNAKVCSQREPGEEGDLLWKINVQPVVGLLLNQPLWQLLQMAAG